MYDIMMQNLLSPIVLFFILGILAALLKSDLKFPDGLSEGLSIYLLIAIGITGGIELSHYSLQDVTAPILGALILGIVIPIITLVIMRLIKIDIKNAIALAATYGSVSIVTYGAAIGFLNENSIEYEGLINALVVVLESPAIIFSLILLNILEKMKNEPIQSFSRLGITPAYMNLIDKKVIKESLFGKSVFLLLGSLLVGIIVGEEALPTVKPLFIDLYKSALILFLLNMGLIAGQRLPEMRSHGMKLVLFGMFMPLIGGSLGVIVGTIVGFSLGGVTLMGVLAGSSSYIAAPAALRTSVPEANPSIYLGLSLGITFPFNLIVGIPIYYQMAQLIN